MVYIEDTEHWVEPNTIIIPIRGDLGITKEDIENAPRGDWNIRALTEVVEKETK